jgi:glutathione S-transferase
VRLYNSQLSGNCWKVRQMLGLLGIRYERIELDVVDRSNRPAVLGGKNPALRVPTLELDDGEHLAESNAILWYLAGGTPYLPADRLEQARALQWMFFEQYEVEPSLAVVRFWLAYSGTPESLSSTRRDELVQSGNRALAALERNLETREWLVGDEMTIADISLYVYTHVAHEGGFDLAPYTTLRAWFDRVAAEPGHVPIDA